jgi:hypothetical protein
MVDTLVQLGLEEAFVKFDISTMDNVIKIIINLDLQKQAIEEAQEIIQLELVSKHFAIDIKVMNSIPFLLLKNNIDSFFLNL